MFIKKVVENHDLQNTIFVFTRNSNMYDIAIVISNLARSKFGKY